MKRSLFIALMLLIASVAVEAQETSVSLSGVDTLVNGELPINQPISFYFRISNQSAISFEGSANGFRIYSTDGATWEPALRVDTNNLGGFPVPSTTYDTTWYGEFLDEGLPPPLSWSPQGAFPGIYEGINTFLNSFSTDGTGADTVGFAGFAQNPSSALGFFAGLVADPAWVIRLTSIDSSSVGKTICLDSSYYPPAGPWVWANGVQVNPAWDGPHCFVVGDCCIGTRGNFDNSNMDIDIADLTSLVGYMFGSGGGSMPCLLAANVNGDGLGDVDISDLTFLVNYMFRGGPEPPACP